mmetsp:Transcript_17138/g.39575  ORF Transcript_17138/g.39575 Transcript_17138/m.39575 type:complete len:122 (-) Transcript_17138:60-425(-)
MMVARSSEYSAIKALHFVRSDARCDAVVLSLQEGKASEHFFMAVLGSRVDTTARIVVGEAGSKTGKFSSPAGGSSGQLVREGSFKSCDNTLLATVGVDEKLRTDATIRLLESPNSLDDLRN